jgi:hypothetical protein
MIVFGLSISSGRQPLRKGDFMQVEYKNIDPKLIVNEIRNGRSLESVQKLFGLRFKSEVQDLYLRGLMELGEIPKVAFNNTNSARSPLPRPEPSVARRRDRTNSPSPVLVQTANFRTIGQSGSITLNKALLIEQLGFQIGDYFEICREDDRVVLKKVAAPE